MKFFCKKLHTPNGITSYCYYPFLLVKLINSANVFKSIEIEGLIDSGADCSIINAAYAKTLLNVDYKKGFLAKTKGITDKEIDVYYHKVDLEIVGMNNSRCKILLGFMEGLKIGLLLGRKDFFENFRITFDMVNYTFELDSYSSIFASRL